ncbi:MAG: single-stranded DNA-binding protein [Puniceicoccales bacterium]|jgi:single-strand DNA-binding protein|nr:single-stranded DNA-binding protein [Puniceicoccales bacterium]
MASFNKVIILGNLTRDPEVRTTNSGTTVCRFGVATTRISRGNDGENREEVVFVDVDAFAKQAEVIGRYFTKGRPIFIEGRLRLDQWESATGEKRSKLCVVLENFQFIGSARLEEETGDGNFSNPAPVALKKEETSNVPSMARPNEALDEDVPF